MQGSFVNVSEDSAFEGDAVFDALTEKPGEEDGGVDADTGEGGTGIAV